MASFDFPGTPSNGQSYTANGITYTFDGTAWKRETGAVKGQKGEVGDKGQKGESVKGEKGQKGIDGTNAGKGQKGEVGDKGQKGVDGTLGAKGQKGQTGADNSTKGDKGQKGEIGATTKGQKGEVGTGVKGQKGEEGESGMTHLNQSSGYTLVAADDQRLVTTTSNITVPTGVFSAGDAITIYNNSGSNITINQGGTMYLVGTSTSGNRVLAERGLATIVCVASNTFVISGGGLS